MRSGICVYLTSVNKTSILDSHHGEKTFLVQEAVIKCEAFFIQFIILHKFFFLPCPTAYGTLVSQLGIELELSAVKARSLNCWTAKDVPYIRFCITVGHAYRYEHKVYYHLIHLHEYPVAASRLGNGTSLVVPWLRFWAPTAEGLGLILGQGTRSHVLQPRFCMLQLGPGTAK